MFLATGQDPAHTVEGSNCITLMEEVRAGEEPRCGGQPGDLRVSVTMPSLPVGVVGGGTGLPAQAACLRLMGCSLLPRPNKSEDIVNVATRAEPLPASTSETTLAVRDDAVGIGVGSEGVPAGSGVIGDGGVGFSSSGAGAPQRAAINLVAEVAAAAAAAAAEEVEQAATTISLLPGAPTPEAGGVTSPLVVGGGPPLAVGSTGKGKGPALKVCTTSANGVDVGSDAAGKPEDDMCTAPDVVSEQGARRLACIVGAAVLAGELSLLAALTSNDLVSAHMSLNRGQAGAPAPGASCGAPTSKTVMAGSDFADGPPSPSGIGAPNTAYTSQALEAEPVIISNGSHPFPLHAGPATAMQLGEPAHSESTTSEPLSGMTAVAGQTLAHTGSGHVLHTQGQGHDAGVAGTLQPEAMQPGPAAMHAAVQAAPRMFIQGEVVHDSTQASMSI